MRTPFMAPTLPQRGEDGGAWRSSLGVLTSGPKLRGRLNYSFVNHQIHDPTTQAAGPVAQAPKVLVGMSGGVDSSVAATVLAEQGYDVIGSMLRFWPDERPEGAFDLCCSPDAAYDARRVADELDVPFYLLDFRDRFQEVVIDPFVPGYQAGTTPNPCVWCNREIKFGAFVKRAQALGCEFM